MTESNAVAVKTLAAFIKAELPELTVLEEWPDPKKDLKLPCLVITTKGKARLTNQPATIASKVAVPGKPLQKKVAYVIGLYDCDFQLDLWTDYKAKRNEWYERIVGVFDKQFIDSGRPTGISLELLDYNNCFARYDQTGYTYLDSEVNSQREEWRAKIDVVASYPRVKTKIETIMAEITLKDRVSEEADVLDKPTDEEVKIPKE